MIVDLKCFKFYQKVLARQNNWFSSNKAKSKLPSFFLRNEQHVSVEKIKVNEHWLKLNYFFFNKTGQL